MNVSVEVPSGRLRGRSGFLCTVCVRVVLPDLRPWSWFGCESCRTVDARVASLFKARRLLPQGQHSMMNGLSMRVGDVSDVVAGVFADGIAAMHDDWSVLLKWRETETQRLAHSIGVDVGLVPLDRWEAVFPPAPRWSADAYRRLLEEGFGWVIEAEPNAGNVDWLVGECR